MTYDFQTTSNLNKSICWSQEVTIYVLDHAGYYSFQKMIIGETITAIKIQIQNHKKG